MEVIALLEHMPVATVRWIDRDQLRANDYNPNHVAPMEMELLATSIVEDGWTQPIVIRSNGEIVDGFHRWTVSGRDDVRALTDGLVPVVVLADDVSADHQRMSTIRHNRARGTHHVLRMAEIVRDLIDDKGVPREEVARRLQMEEEEVERLYDARGMNERGAGEGFNAGWVPGD